MIIRYLKGLSLQGKHGKISYAQSGEDLIIDFIFDWMKIGIPEYLDLGAHHPTSLSNTYFFYRKGCKGVCVEPDPELHGVLQKVRKRDVCLNFGVAAESKGWADFYIMTSKTLNTFSKKEVENYQKYYPGCKIENVIQVKLVPINEIVETYFRSSPNLVSIDVEGTDFEVLKSFDLARFRPEVICIETITYQNDRSLRKSRKIAEHLIENNYFMYADTFINSIFVDKKAWSNRGLPDFD
jgi:FkbM family methyltransferase